MMVALKARLTTSHDFFHSLILTSSWSSLAVFEQLYATDLTSRRYEHRSMASLAQIISIL